MDIDRLDRYTTLKRNKIIFYVFILIVIITSATWIYKYGYNGSSIKLSELWISEVEYSDLLIYTTASGQLKTNNKQSITSKISGTVIHINKKQGDSVKIGETLLKLENTNIYKNVIEIQFDLDGLIANHQVLLADIEIDKLNKLSEIDKIGSTIELLALKLNAKEELFKKSIISKISILEARLELKNTRKLHKNTQLNYNLYLKSIEAKINASSIIIDKNRLRLISEKEKINELKIKSNISGIVNSIMVDLGGYVKNGQLVSQISDNTKLVALLNINEFYSDQLQLEQKVVVSMMNTKIKGRILKISPQIKNNYIEIEATFEEKLPVGVRPDMSVTADIVFRQLKNVMIIDKPKGMKPNQKNSVYVLNEGNLSIKPVVIHTGQSSTDKIEILYGLKVGDKVVINEINNQSQSNESIKIIK